ncbi:MAG: hypothetical protein V3S55_10845, partial [Nitrospiraceae bacterium]
SMWRVSTPGKRPDEVPEQGDSTSTDSAGLLVAGYDRVVLEEARRAVERCKEAAGKDPEARSRPFVIGISLGQGSGQR